MSLNFKKPNEGYTSNRDLTIIICTFFLLIASLTTLACFATATSDTKSGHPALAADTSAADEDVYGANNGTV